MLLQNLDAEDSNQLCYRRQTKIELSTDERWIQEMLHLGTHGLQSPAKLLNCQLALSHLHPGKEAVPPALKQD